MQTDGGGENEVVTVKEVDLCLAENGPPHHTEKYELMEREKDPKLVVRRGQQFVMRITLSRGYNPEKDAVSFIFTVVDAEKPNYGQGSLVAVPLLANGAESGGAWNAVLENSTENIITVHITPAADSIIGQWNIEIDTKLKNDVDQVYMEGDNLLAEYVLADTGLIWRGSYNRLRPCVWKYAQFEKDILDCALYLLTKVGKVGLSGRSDPIKTTRAMSAAVNSPDDNGAVQGNWSDDFGSHTPPTKWIGSMKILQQFYKNKKPVKTVTTYSSAHDTQNSLTVDYFVNEEGETMEELNNDSIWNFHVWNEVWMDRPDLLPGDYGGWQAIDATPQELSEDMFRCGPASVAAVKQGEVLRPYDNAFVFSEVNADKVFWRYAGPTQPLKLLRKDVLGIGQLISTKAVGEFKREDITDSYKYPEIGIILMMTLMTSTSTLSSGMTFVVVVMKNRSRTENYTVKVILRVDAVLYTGTVKDAIKRDDVERVVKAGAVEEIRMEVTYDEYYRRLVDQCAFNIACLATIQGNNYEYFAQDDFRVRKPDIKIKIEGEPVQGQEFSAVATLKNPLPIPLKKGQFLIEGPGITSQLKIKVPQNVAPNTEATVTFKMTPKFSGRSTIVAKFVAKELEDVDGFLNFMVEPKNEVNGTGNSTAA
uniref:Transglutaminase-like domain-containing protein n=1 Tax=Timema douglasi TaxID=61478 RepID=A0A7R8VD19_TIMDO|nr:unnamed protein product [Timema douglasi]